MKNWKIGTRIYLLSAILFVGCIVVGFTGWYSLRLVDTKSAEALRQSALVAEAADIARSAQVEFKIQVQEWKNILLRGNDAKAFDKYRQGFIKSGDATKSDLEKLNGMLTKLGVTTPLVDEALKTHEELRKRYLEALEQYDQKNPNSSHHVDKLVAGIDRVPTQKIDAIVSFIQEKGSELNQGRMAELDSYTRNIAVFLFACVLGALLVGASIAVVLVRNITRPLAEAVKVAETVASGNLTSRIEVRSQDETGQLLDALKRMNDSLTGIVRQVRQGTETIATASAQIAAGNQDLSSRTEEQASSLEETASSMEQLTSTVRQNGANAAQANQLAINASDIAEKGGAMVAGVVETMEAINGASRKMADIINVIDGIAFQTNILALNAAVEAARAGEQGRGFAVVATEVRSLAQRSASAAREIKTLIDDSVTKVDAGSKLVSQAGETMTEIVGSIRRVTDIMADINAATREQVDGIEQVNQAVSQMDQVTQQNAALVEEAAAAAESMQDQATKLVEVVSVFNTGQQVSTSAQSIVAKHNAKTVLARQVKPGQPARASGAADWDEF